MRIRRTGERREAMGTLLFIFIAKPLGRSLVVSLPPETAVFMEVPAGNAGPVLHIARSFATICA